MFRGDNSHSLSYEQQAKFIHDRITNVEKNFGELCVAFGDYARRTARLRDQGDELAKVLKDYANNEIVNKSLSSGLENLSITLTAIEEYRNCEVQRLEAKVIGELCQYEAICKHAREEVKHTMNVRDKELARKKVLDKTRERQPFNRQQVTYAESELLKASAEMSRTAKGLSEQTEFFERRKLQQLKALLSDFLLIELSFHGKALELLTVAHQQVDDINDKADLEHFRRKLRSPEKQVSTGVSARSSSLASLLQPSPSREDDPAWNKLCSERNEVDRRCDVPDCCPVEGECSWKYSTYKLQVDGTDIITFMDRIAIAIRSIINKNMRRLRTPEKHGAVALPRAASLAALSAKQEDETTDSEESEEGTSSEETESR